MKKIVLLIAFISISIFSCTPDTLESTEKEELKLVDKDEIVRPGDQGGRSTYYYADAYGN